MSGQPDIKPNQTGVFLDCLVHELNTQRQARVAGAQRE